MTELRIDGLRAAAGGTEILRGIDIVVRSGEVHAVMGPNGSGKSTLSHVVLGHPGYEVLAGSITLDGADVLAMDPWERAQAGLFLAMQYPTEVPGVALADVLDAAFAASGRDTTEVPALVAAEAAEVGFGDELLTRAVNVDLSGGEKKRHETVQLGALRPRIAVLDELDSGLDVDGLRQVSKRIERATNDDALGVLAITHYSRLLHELHPDRVHVLVGGVFVAEGDAALAWELEETGYAPYGADASDAPSSRENRGDPFADPLS